MGVIRRFLTGNSIVRPGIGSLPDDEGEFWFSWMRWFQYAFVGFTLLAVVGVVTEDAFGMWESTIGALAGIALAAWVWSRGRWERIHSNGEALLYLAVTLVLIATALYIYDAFILVTFGAYWHGFAFLRFKPGIAYAAIITITVQVVFMSFGIPQLLGGAVGLLFAGMIAAYVEGLSRDTWRRQQLLDELRAAQDALAVQEREAGMEAERQRLAGEIHDTVAQQFTSIVTNLHAAEARMTTDPGAAQGHIRAALDAARQGIADARSMVHALQPQVLEGRSIGEALCHIANDLPHAAPDVAFREIGTPAQLDRVRETILVRALQEALQNVRKHAQATSIEVSLSWLEDEVILDVQDDGAGFDPASTPPPEHGHRVGLHTMRQRVESAGGTWSIESTPGEGTSIAISFPLDRDPKEVAHE